MAPRLPGALLSSADLALGRLAASAVDATLADLRAHRLELVAAAELRKRGQQLSKGLTAAERAAAVTSLVMPAVLCEIRRAVEGRILLVKGPEVAAHYPSPMLRSYGDLDILVEDAPAAHSSLLHAGFVEVGNPKVYRDIHHLRPIVLSGVGLPVEVHSRPKWIETGRPPTLQRLFVEAVPSATSIDGIEAPSPAHHALLLAVHSWAHEPLRRLRDLLDIAFLRDVARPREIDSLSEELGVRKLWASTEAAIEAITDGSRLPMPVRLWARNIELARERTVFEDHLSRWLSGFAADPPRKAIRGLSDPLKRTFMPDHERPGQKFHRSVRAMRNARTRRSEHQEDVQSLMPPPFAER